jgi:hypothetical protein
MKTPLKSADEELSDLRKIAAEHSDCRWWFCIHHDILLETLYDDSTVEDRIAEILRSKPAEEHATRFRNLRPLVGELPTAVAETWAACSEARAARDKAGVACDKAWAAYNEAVAAFNKAWADYRKAAADHAAEITDLMNIQWPGNTWNGKNIGWE